MNCDKIGSLILTLRKEKNLTQKNLADLLNISDKTISKWERGLGCPDVSLLPSLSDILGTNIEKLLLGNLKPNDIKGGNMKKIQFYVCPNCDNIMTVTNQSEISCCGRKLSPLIPRPVDEKHHVDIADIENDYYITLKHDMTKSHYISFFAFVSYDKVFLEKLYPEQNAEVRIPRIGRGKLYFYCNQHGFFEYSK